MESDQLHVPAVFRHVIPFHEGPFLFSGYNCVQTRNPFSSFFEQGSSQQFHFFCAEKGLNLKLESPDPLMGKDGKQSDS